MAIRVQHQGAGAGAGIDDGFKRKYDMRLQQLDKQQDRMFRIGLQNRDVALQRENMLIANNMRAGERQAVREAEQADLKEQRDFAAKLRGEQRANEIADMEGQRKFQMDLLAQQQQRQDEIHNRQRAEGFENADVMMQQQWIQQGIERGDFTDEATQMLKQNISDELAILKNPQIDATQRAEALARVRDDRRIISVHGRRPMEAPQEVKQPTAREAFQADPKLFEQYMGVVNGSIPEGETMSAAERMSKAQQLYDSGQDPVKLEAMVNVEKFNSQLPFGKMIPETGNAPEMQRLQEFASSQPPEIQKAMGVMIDPNSSAGLRYYANSLLEKRGITPDKIREISSGSTPKAANGTGSALDKYGVTSEDRQNLYRGKNADGSARVEKTGDTTDYTPRYDAPIKDFSKLISETKEDKRPGVQAMVDYRDNLVKKYKDGVKNRDANEQDMNIARWIDVFVDPDSPEDAQDQALEQLLLNNIDPDEIRASATKPAASPSYMPRKFGSLK